MSLDPSELSKNKMRRRNFGENENICVVMVIASLSKQYRRNVEENNETIYLLLLNDHYFYCVVKPQPTQRVECHQVVFVTVVISSDDAHTMWEKLRYKRRVSHFIQQALDALACA